MTIPLDVLKGGGAPRGTPRRRGSPRLAAMAMIAILTALQAGCQSGGYGRCNSCGLFRRATSWISRRPSGCGCGSSVVGDAGVEYSAPSTVVGPATTVTPMLGAPPATTTVPSTVPLPSDSGATHLESIPKARIGPEPGTSSRGNPGPTSFFPRSSATRTAARIERHPTAERASMSRPAADDEATTVDEAPADDDPLDHLPPLGLPGEVTQSAMGSPSPTAPRPSGTDREVVATADIEFGQVSAEASPAANAGGGGPGIARFAPVDPELAGGSVPSAAGLAWLVEKGYRTLLDLRDPGDVPPAFIADVAARGLRYVALPVDLAQLDPEKVARFQFELKAREARPLYFFDADGGRAGALWYIRRVAFDRVDAAIARREAEEIGLKDPSAWRSTTAYLDRLEASKAHPAPAPPAAASAPTPAAATRAPATTAAATTDTALLPAKPKSKPSAPRSAGDLMTDLDVPAYRPEELIPPVAERSKSLIVTPEGAATLPIAAREVAPGWRPFATMLITGLTLPLVYWTRGAIPDAIARARASLPGAGPRPRSLPPASGE